MKDISDYSLKTHNTFGIDVRCRRFIEFCSVEEAQQVAAILREASCLISAQSSPSRSLSPLTPQPYIIIGGGSNLLLTRDFDGIVVRSAINTVMEDGERVLCGSGVEWDRLVEKLVNRGLYGAENLSLIPGDVGATAVQNIGAYGVEACELIERVWAIDIATGKQELFMNDECGYGYRQSHFKNEWKNRYLITQVDYRLSREFRPRLDYGNIRAELERRGIGDPTPQQLRQVIIDIRREKLPDPKDLGNAGSFFMNPVVGREEYERLAARYDGMPHYDMGDKVKIPAGWMIEQCGWKGRSLGRAGVHDKQALVLVNRGGAIGQEIVDLCRAIQRDVKARFGIDIQPEVNIV